MAEEDKKRGVSRPSGSTPDPKNPKTIGVIDVPREGELSASASALAPVPAYPSESSGSKPKMENVFEKQNQIMAALQEQNVKMFDHFTSQNMMVIEKMENSKITSRELWMSYISVFQRVY